MDGVYVQWMRFSYDQAIMEKLLKERGYRPAEKGVGYGELIGPVKPEWWPDVNQSQIELYVLENVTKQPSFRAFLWHDKSSNHIYFYRGYWD